jgi:hypothetical protein
MALTAAVNVNVTPMTLTVVSDKRVLTGSVTVAGETAEWTAELPITINDTIRTWTLVSDDGKTAIYTTN